MMRVLPITTGVAGPAGVPGLLIRPCGVEADRPFSGGPPGAESGAAGAVAGPAGGRPMGRGVTCL